MGYRVVRSAASDRDLELIFDHLTESYLSLGDALPDALERAACRILSIEDDMNGLARVPHQSTLLPDTQQGLRQVTKREAIFYFEMDEPAELVRIFAVFFGGQDHRRHMLKRLIV